MADDLGGADEGDFLELLIANERVLSWIDELQTPGNPARKKEIVLQLKELVDSKHSYAEEAKNAGVLPLLTRILSTTDDPTLTALTGDEEVMDAISHIMVACSGPMASGGKVSDYTYGSVSVRIREGALGDGLGARVWTVAHILCKELVGHAGFVAGHDVLEIGAGCGVCGVVAAKLGASQVVLTDVEGPVLRNLRDCVLLNTSPTASPAQQPDTQPLASLAISISHPGKPSTGSIQCSQPAATSEEQPNGQPEDSQRSGRVGADGSSTLSPGAGPDSTSDAWASENMLVRKLDWLESLQFLRDQQPSTSRAAASSRPAIVENGSSTSQEHDASTAGQHQQHAQQPGPHAEQGDLDPSRFYANDLLRMADDCTMPGNVPPDVPLDRRYSRIIGTDIMYEPMHAALVAAVLAHRLEEGGAALLCCAVRQARTFTAFTSECARWGLRYRKRQVQPAVEYGGIMGRDEDYEGGFLIMAVDHMAHPCDSWHRHDWD